MFFKPHTVPGGTEEKKRRSRIISEATENRLEKIHSFTQYVIIGAAGAYVLQKVLRGYFSWIPSEISGSISMDTLSIFAGAMIGAVVARLLSYR